MGQEIVYCAKCQSRILGSDFEKGTAVRLDSQAWCRACAPAAPPTPKPLPAPRPAPASKGTARRPTAQQRLGLPAIAGIVAGGLLLLALLAAALGGRPSPPRPPAETLRETAAAPTAEAPRRTSAPPPSRAKGVPEQLADLDAELQGYLRKNEHANALMVLEAARKVRPEAAWTSEIERRTQEIARQYEAFRAKAKAVAPKVEPPPPPPPPKPPEPKPPEPKPTPPAATAAFVGVDTATRGNWKGTYGADGFEIALGASKLPAFTRVTPAGHLTHSWSAATAEPRALEKADGPDRIAACWHAETSFDLEVDLADGNPRRAALYCVDWDSANRAQTIDVLDAVSGTVLDRRSLASFAEGAYVVWDLKGRVKFRLTRTAGPNAVVSAVFLGPGGAVTPAGPVLWLPLDEGKGLEAGDLSGRGNVGTLRGGAAWADGKHGRALRLDGRDDHVRVPDSPSLRLAGAGLTLSAWVFRQADQKRTALVLARQRGTGADDQFHLGFRDNLYVFGVGTADGVRSVQGPVAPTLQWIHLAATYDGTHVRLSINGAPPIARGYEKSAPILADARPVIVGAAQNRPGDDVQEAFSGRIDDVRLFARALGPAELAGLAAGRSTDAAGLVGRWRFDEGSGASAADASPHRHAGTLENGAAWAAGKSGGAVSFDGGDDHVLVPDSPAIAAIAGRLTVAAWAYRAADQNEWRPIVTRPRNPDAYEHFWLGFHNNGYNFGVDTPAGEKAVEGPRAPLRQWTHLAGTYDGATVRLYVDGREAAFAAHSGEIRRDSRPLCLGARRNPVTGAVGYAFRGLLDEVHLYDRALAPAEIAALAADSPVPR